LPSNADESPGAPIFAFGFAWVQYEFSTGSQNGMSRERFPDMEQSFFSVLPEIGPIRF